MKKYCSIISIVLLMACTSSNNDKEKKEFTKLGQSPLVYQLSDPVFSGNLAVEEALKSRRSQRNFTKNKIDNQSISQILWAAYGITKLAPDEPYIAGGYRTTPSAGAIYPLNIYLLCGNIKGIENGVYKYNPIDHTITRIIEENIKKDLSIAALNQAMIDEAPACLLISASFDKMIERFGERGHTRYVYMEAGHSAQNIYLQVQSLNLGTCSIAAFNDEEIKRLMRMGKNEEPLYILPIGKYYK